MGIEKILNSMGIELEYEDDNENEVSNAHENAEPKKSRRSEAREARENKENRESREASDVTITSDPGVKAKVVLVEPSKFTDARKVCRELKAGNVVVMNFEKLNEADSLRVYDVVQGATFVLEGSIQDISENVTVAAPRNVDIQTNELQAKETYDNSELEYNY